MDDTLRSQLGSVPNLRDAIRRARLADADRSAAVAELHTAEIVRLELLEEALRPVLAQVPDDVELFDHGLIRGEQPRLYVDMLAFVEMARDRRQYRLVQDARWGRRTLAESESLQAMVDAVADYVALRLVERAKALTSDALAPLPASQAVIEKKGAVAPAPEAAPLPASSGWGTRLAMLVWFVTGLVLGAAGFYAAAIAGLHPFR